MHLRVPLRWSRRRAPLRVRHPPAAVPRDGPHAEQLHERPVRRNGSASAGPPPSGSGAPPPPMLVLGFGDVAESSIDRGIAAVGDLSGDAAAARTSAAPGPVGSAGAAPEPRDAARGARRHPRARARVRNRGCLHDGAGRIRRRYAGRRWIACRLEFRGRRRTALMQQGRYTELFFLDEATALAAGHRPCAECRRADYDRFVAIWRELHPPTRARTRSTRGSMPSDSIPFTRAQRRRDARPRGCRTARRPPRSRAVPRPRR